MPDSLLPSRPPDLPKADKLHGAQLVLEELAAFVDRQPGYQVREPAGWRHLRAVIAYVEWAAHNQHLPRRG